MSSVSLENRSVPRSVEKIIRDVSDEIVLHEHLLREYAQICW
jgi:hypothetical protein